MEPIGTAGRRAAFTAYAGRWATLAVANVCRPYPYAPQQLLRGPEDLALPRERHPAFYGSYDWHSSVHMHWLLVRLLRRASGEVDADAVRRVLDGHLTEGNLAAEVRARRGFMPYGAGWLVMLAAECAMAGAEGLPGGRTWARTVRPAAEVMCGRFEEWLAKATYPVRYGTHGNSAFAVGLFMDAAGPLGVDRVREAARDAVLRWFLADRDYPARWEPSGEDFLSAALTEADAVRRVLSGPEFARWLTGFLPGLASGEPAALLRPPVVSDPHDPLIGHLLGLALSRAAALRSIAAALPTGDPRAPVLDAAADEHLTAGLPTTVTGDFATDHWLATFGALALDTGPTGEG